jgi:hypothetical protein
MENILGFVVLQSVFSVVGDEHFVAAWGFLVCGFSTFY